MISPRPLGPFAAGTALLLALAGAAAAGGGGGGHGGHHGGHGGQGGGIATAPGATLGASGPSSAATAPAGGTTTLPAIASTPADLERLDLQRRATEAAERGAMWTERTYFVGVAIALGLLLAIVLAYFVARRGRRSPGA